MRKIRHLKTTVRLVLPLLAIFMGFFCHSLTVSVIVWLLATAAIAINVFLMLLNMTENAAINNVLNFANLYVLGVIILPFALLGLVFWGLGKLVCMACKALSSRRETVKRILAAFVLNASIWGMTLSVILPESLLICILTANVCLLAIRCS